MLSLTLSLMASLRRKPNSQYWFACFTLPNGQRAQRSTKTTNRKLALKLAEEYEAASRTRMTEVQVRRVLSDLHRMHSGAALNSTSTREFLDQWMRSKGGTVSAGTRVTYEAVVRDFCAFLGSRAEAELLYLTKADIAAFRDKVASTRAASTANKQLKILRVALQQAWRDGVLDDNPAAKVPLLKGPLEQVTRRPFRLEELQRLLRAADGDWKGVILFGVYTGQRLGDLARLRWSNLDLEQGTLAFTTRKTHRRQILPLARPLLAWLEPLAETGVVRDGPIFPALSSAVEKSGRVGTLSNRFSDLMASAGIVQARSHRRKVDGAGRDGRRTAGALSFHSLRHTATSLMKNAGVSPAVVQEFVGHDSKVMSEHYTHIELASLRQAADALPELE
jgi:integrase